MLVGEHPLNLFFSYANLERRIIRCNTQMSLSAPFAPTSPNNHHLTESVPEGSKAERSDQGYLSP